MSQEAIEDSVRLEVRLLSEHAKLPFRSRSTDAGYDLYSAETVVLVPKEITTVHTHIQIAAPPGFYYTIEGRSSLHRLGIFPNRAIIDATYTGEAFVQLFNTSNDAYIVKLGERVAQLVLHKQYHAEFDMVEEFSPWYNQRGMNGFGSTGK